MKKKNEKMIFFVIFPAAGNMKKNNKNNNYNEKKMVQIWKGYCPNRIVRKYFVLQGKAGLYCSLRENCIARVALYCNREDWAGKILYCRLGGVVLQDCIARGLQENCIAIRKLYCDSRGLRQGLYCDTTCCRATIRHAGRSRRAQGALGARGARRQARQAVGRARSAQVGVLAGMAQGTRQEALAIGTSVQQAQGHRAWHGVGARGARLGAWSARLGARSARGTAGTDARPVLTGWTSWVLVHLTWFSTWFFDSVFFLSH